MKRGFSIPEVLTALTLFALMILIMTAAFKGSTQVWRRSSGVSVVQTQLGKAAAALARELENADFEEVRVSDGPNTLGAAPDGSAIWFLSSVEPGSGTPLRKDDGSPFWQRNVLIYAVVPSAHTQTFGTLCQGGFGPDGFDDHCPHKILVRKVIDRAPATDPSDETTEETLLTPSEVAGYLTRPQGFDLNPMLAEPGVEQATVLANSLLYARFVLEPQPASYPEEIEIDLRSVMIAQAQREVAVGQVSLSSHPLTVQRLFSVFPQN